MTPRMAHPGGIVETKPRPVAVTSRGVV
jgi:hypothetical protein